MRQVYEIKEDKNGQTVRVDRWTGEVMLVVGDTLVRVKTPREQEQEQKEAQQKEASLAQARQMSDIPIPQLGDTTASLTIAWREGKLYYQFSLHPESKRLQEARRTALPRSQSFTIVFFDAGGFKINDKTFPIYSMEQTVDTANSPVSLNANDSEYLSIEDYKANFVVECHVVGILSYATGT